MKNGIRETPVSFGMNIKQPHRLTTKPVGEVLDGIRLGVWRKAVERVRGLTGSAQTKAKNSLPFFTPSGEFAYRRDEDLIGYSGIVVIDLDDLPGKKIAKALQTAVVDRHCFAAFRSPRGNGLKLLFRVPVQYGFVHREIHSQVAAHVRNKYGVRPDKGADVSRPCFVSWDDGAWIYGRAKELPIVEPSFREETPRARSSEPVTNEPIENFSEEELEHGPHEWKMLGWDCAPSKLKPNDLSYTNKSLLTLARKASTQIAKLRERPEPRECERLLAVAFRGWQAKAGYRKLQRPLKVYWKELVKMFRSQMRSPHPEKNASTWTRWCEHPDFPRSADPREKIMFAIRKNCEEWNTDSFFLSTEDAGRVAGLSKVSGLKHLRRLVKEGRICHHPSTQKRRGGQRKAQRYLLLPGGH